MSTRNTNLFLAIREATPLPDAVSEIISWMVVEAEAYELDNTKKYFESCKVRASFLITGATRHLNNDQSAAFTQSKTLISTNVTFYVNKWNPYLNNMSNTPWLLKTYRADVRILQELISDSIEKYKLFPSNAPQNARYVEEEI